MLGLSREKFPGLVTAVYVGLVLYCLFGALKASEPEAGATWEVFLFLLVCPLALTFRFIPLLLPWLDGPATYTVLILVFAAANAAVIRRVCKSIVGVG